MQKKILAVVAHPDDESFGIGGTLAKYAQAGVDIHVLCVTRGESGRGGVTQAAQREQELREASRILGVAKVELLNFADGMLSNNLYHTLAEKIEGKIIEFAPDVVLTYENLGVSGHIDHIVVSLVTTFVVRKFKHKMRLFYFCELKKFAAKRADYFVYFPQGYDKSQIDVIIDTEKTWDTKVRAMYAHKSQIADVKTIMSYKKDAPKREFFIQAFKNKKQPKRNDFFAA